MNTQVKYPSVQMIPRDELPCYEDADGDVRLCENCHTDYIERYLLNETPLRDGDLCVGCGFRSSGAVRDNLTDAIDSLMQARLCGATEDDARQVLKEVQFAVERERWKDGERALPPTNPSGGLFYLITHKPRRTVRRLVRRH